MDHLGGMFGGFKRKKPYDQEEEDWADTELAGYDARPRREFVTPDPERDNIFWGIIHASWTDSERHALREKFSG